MSYKYKSSGMSGAELLGACAVVFALFVGIYLIVLPWLFVWAWNTFMVGVFNAATINYVEALAGLVLLLSLIHI